MAKPSQNYHLNVIFSTEKLFVQHFQAASS